MRELIAQLGRRFLAHLGIILAVAVIGYATSAAASTDCPTLDLEVVSLPAPPQAQSWKQYKAGLLHPANVALLGDSHAYYWPADIFAQAFPNTQSVNLGVPGDRAQNTLWRLDDDRLRQISPRSTVLFIGTNNLIDGTAPCAIAHGTALIVAKVHSLWPASRLIIIKPFRNGGFGERFRDEVADYWTRLASEELPSGTVLLDLNAAVSCSEESYFSWYVYPEDIRPVSPCPIITKDLGHLTGEGYRKLGNAMAAALSSIAVSP
ncbi:SGNH/GDSL hydrolase family protein [Devosia sp.]|uniref:SGNH/GDSL hydrolase family protein n=1 Tax=Devosia sp. TaxID=1871048 RepID=UPI003BA9D750